jgi:hypothetical protein
VKSEDREERRCDENEAEDEEAPLSRGLVGVGGQTLHMTENYACTATSIWNYVPLAYCIELHLLQFCRIANISKRRRVLGTVHDIGYSVMCHGVCRCVTTYDYSSSFSWVKKESIKQKRLGEMHR